METSLEDALVERLAAALQMRPCDGRVTPAEHLSAEQLAVSRYSTPEFTRRR